MRPLKRKITVVNGSKYCLVPFFVAEPYGIEAGSPIEFDTSDSDVLVIKIRKEVQK